MARTKCKNCGAKLCFDPETENLKCEACGSLYQINEKPAKDMKPIFESTQKEENNIKLNFCENCGASVPEEYSNSGVCVYCNHSLKVNENIQVADAVIPFKISKEQVVEKFNRRLKKRFYVPNNFKKENCVDAISSRYIEIIQFNCFVKGYYSGVLTIESGENRTEENVRGNISEFIPDIIVENSKVTSSREVSSIMPFNLGEIKDYNEEFLTGYPVEIEEGDINSKFEVEGKRQIERYLKGKLNRKYSRGSLQIDNLSFETFDVKFRKIYVPIHFMKVNYKNKIYTPIMNGQTGEIGGDMPISKIKVFFTALPVFLIIILVIILVIIN